MIRQADILKRAVRAALPVAGTLPFKALQKA